MPVLRFRHLDSLPSAQVGLAARSLYRLSRSDLRADSFRKLPAWLRPLVEVRTAQLRRDPAFARTLLHSASAFLDYRLFAQDAEILGDREMAEHADLLAWYHFATIPPESRTPPTIPPGWRAIRLNALRESLFLLVDLRPLTRRLDAPVFALGLPPRAARTPWHSSLADLEAALAEKT